MADNWRKKGLLGKDTIWRDIDTTNTVLARCYGLRKIHKENYPLRLVVSTINILLKIVGNFKRLYSQRRYLMVM